MKFCLGIFRYCSSCRGSLRAPGCAGTRQAIRDGSYPHCAASPPFPASCRCTGQMQSHLKNGKNKKGNPSPAALEKGDTCSLPALLPNGDVPWPQPWLPYVGIVPAPAQPQGQRGWDCALATGCKSLGLPAAERLPSLSLRSPRTVFLAWLPRKVRCACTGQHLPMHQRPPRTFWLISDD